MMLSAFLLMLVAAPGADAREVVIRTPTLSVGDIVPKADLPADIRARIVLRLPAGDHWVLDGAALAGLVRRRVPGLPTTGLEQVKSVSVRRVGQERTRPARTCFETAVPVAAGQVLDVDDLGAVPCRDEASARSVRFDRANAIAVAAAPLAAGTYLGAVAPLHGADVMAGTPLTLRSTAGPAIVERTVTAMQPGRNGARLFVRDADGAVFALPLAIPPSRNMSR